MAKRDGSSVPSGGGSFAAFIANAERDRRITAAKTALWLACLGPLLVFAYSGMEMLFGHPDAFSAPQVLSREGALDFAWLAAYGVAAYLVGTRRAIGGALGILLFARSVALAFSHHRLLTLEVGYALVGIALVARSARSLRW